MANFKLNYTGEKISEVLRKADELDLSDYATENYVDNTINREVTSATNEMQTIINNMEFPVDTVLKEGGLNAVQGRTVANNLKKIDRYNEPIITQPDENKYIMSCNLPFIDSKEDIPTDFGSLLPSSKVETKTLWNGTDSGEDTLDKHFGNKFFEETGYSLSQASTILGYRDSKDQNEIQTYNNAMSVFASSGYHFLKSACRENGWMYNIWWFIKDSNEFDAGIIPSTTSYNYTTAPLRLILGKGTVFYYIKGGVNGTVKGVYEVTKTGLYSYTGNQDFTCYDTKVKILTKDNLWNEELGYYYTPIYDAHHEDNISPYQKGIIVKLHGPSYNNGIPPSFEETFATSYEEANPHGNAIDGSSSTYWKGINVLPTTSDGIVKERWYCKLTKPCRASSMKISFNAGISNFDIQASKDGQEWVTIQNITTTTSQGSTYSYAFSNIDEYQYYGVAFYSMTAEGYAQIYEFKIDTINIVKFVNPLFNINGLGNKQINGTIESGYNYEIVYNGESWDINTNSNVTKEYVDNAIQTAIEELLKK